MKYIYQKNYVDVPYITGTELEGEKREKGLTTTVADVGCGLISAVIVADRLLINCNFDVHDAVRISYEAKANGKAGTNYTLFAPAFAKELGLIYKGTSDPNELLHCLRTGGAAGANVCGDRDGYTGVFSKGGHLIAVINEDPDGRIATLDPSYKDGKFDRDGRRGKVEVKNGVISICDLSVLIKETENRSPSFHLFWRA